MSATTTAGQDYPAQILINLIVILLTPMFLAAAGGNVDLARLAATETLDAYRAQSEADLIDAALAIGFGLAALTALSQSMEDGLSVAITIRLRGNATACNRAAQQNRKALRQPSAEHAAPAEPAAPPPESEFDEAEVIAAVAATQQRADENLARVSKQAPTDAPAHPDEPTEAQYQAAWAAGAARVAAEFAAEIPNLPPQQRAEATIRAAALEACAKDLLTGNLPPRPRPGDLAGLFRASGA